MKYQEKRDWLIDQELIGEAIVVNTTMVKRAVGTLLDCGVEKLYLSAGSGDQIPIEYKDIISIEWTEEKHFKANLTSGSPQVDEEIKIARLAGEAVSLG